MAEYLKEMQRCGGVLLVYVIMQATHMYDAIKTALENKLSDKLSGEFGMGEGYMQASQFATEEVAAGLTISICNKASTQLSPLAYLLLSGDRRSIDSLFTLRCAMGWRGAQLGQVFGRSDWGGCWRGVLGLLVC